MSTLAPQVVSPSRAFVRLPNWLGDLVMALPALAALRACWPSTHLTVGLPKSFAGLASLIPGVDAVLPLEGGSGWRAVGRRHPDADAIRGGSFEVALLMTNSFGSALVLRQAGVPERWGYATAGRGWLLTRATHRAGRGERSLHHSAYYAHLARSLGFACAEPVVGEAWGLLRPNATTVAASARALARAGVPDDGRPLVAVAPGAAYGHAKQWPLDRVAALVPLLCAREGARVVLVGAADDRPSGVRIEDALRAAGQDVLLRHRDVVNLIGHTTLLELVGVLARCRGAVSNDSGGMHLAAALGVPVVAVFGPTRDQVTRPLGPHAVVKADVFCRPCMLRECPIDHRCMTRIAAETVAEAAARLWGQARAEVADEPHTLAAGQEAIGG